MNMTLIKRTISIATLLTSLVFTQQAFADHKEGANVSFLNSASGPSRYPFSDAVKVGDLLILSGKIGIDTQKGQLAAGGIKAEAHQTLKNIATSLKTHGYSMKDVVKCTVMLTDINDYSTFNEVYRQHFSAPFPARSVMAVSALALNSVVEIECMAAK